MTGPLKLPSTAPTDPDQATTKTYVDAKATSMGIVYAIALG